MVMRRRRAWADTRFSGQLLVASGTTKDDLLAGLSPSDVKTVTRILVDLYMAYPVGNDVAVDRENSIDVGIGVVSQEAFDLETLPDMNAVADYPQQGWVYIATAPVWRTSMAGAFVAESAHFKADIRAQRKVDRGVLFLSILNIGNIGLDSVFLTGRVRALCLT